MNLFGLAVAYFVLRGPGHRQFEAQPHCVRCCPTRSQRPSRTRFDPTSRMDWVLGALAVLIVIGAYMFSAFVLAD